MNMTAATRRDVVALLLILAAGLLLASWYHHRPDTDTRLYRVVWHDWRGDLEMGQYACRPITAKGPQMSCETITDRGNSCVPVPSASDVRYVRCGKPDDNTLDDAPEDWSR